MADQQLPDYLTIKGACKVIGGDRPIDVSTYYRGAKTYATGPVRLIVRDPAAVAQGR